jgi:hypothetical protein
MTSQQIQTLLAPPNTEESYQQTLLFLNSRFKSLDELNELDTSVEDSLQRQDDLSSQVRSHPLLIGPSELTEPS